MKEAIYDERIVVLVSKDLKNSLQEMADRLGLSLTPFVRMKLIEIVREYETDIWDASSSIYSNNKKEIKE